MPKHFVHTPNAISRAIKQPIQSENGYVLTGKGPYGGGGDWGYPELGPETPTMG